MSTLADTRARNNRWADIDLDALRHVPSGAFDHIKRCELSARVEYRLWPGTVHQHPSRRLHMGSVAGDEEEQPAHVMEVTRPFALQRTEVMQTQWVAIMVANPSRFAACERCPLENASWDQVQTFLRYLNEQIPVTYVAFRRSLNWSRPLELVPQATTMWMACRSMFLAGSTPTWVVRIL